MPNDSGGKPSKGNGGSGKPIHGGKDSKRGGSGGQGNKGKSKGSGEGGPSGTSQPKGGPSGTSGGRREGGPSGTSGDGPSSGAPDDRMKALRKMWRKKGYCISCGAPDHRIKDCTMAPPKPQSTALNAAPKTSSTSTASKATTKTPAAKAPTASGKAKEANSDSRGYRAYTDKNKPSYADAAKGGKSDSKAKSSKAGGSRGEKRQRDAAPTGQTPPAKKAAKDFSYAKATAGATELLILNSEGGHIPQKEKERLEDRIDQVYLDQCTKGESTVNVDKWTYTTKAASVFVADKESIAIVAAEAEKLGLFLKDRRQVEAERRPTTILTGLVTGSTAKRSRQEIELFLKKAVEQAKIDGRLHFYQTQETKSNNLLLRILVDDVAEARLKELDYQIRIGASGLVKFSDERKAKKVDHKRSRQVRIEELKIHIGREKEKITKMYEALDDLEKAETESMSSLGLSKLNVDDKDKADAHTYEELLNTSDEDEGTGKGGSSSVEQMEQQ